MGLIQLEHERFAWARVTFPEATAISSLRKLETEIKEIEDALSKDMPIDVVAEEYADALMCLLDSAQRNGIGPGSLLDAFRAKLDINKTRTWAKNADDSYSHIAVFQESINSANSGLTHDGNGKLAVKKVKGEPKTEVQLATDDLAEKVGPILKIVSNDDYLS